MRKFTGKEELTLTKRFFTVLTVITGFTRMTLKIMKQMNAFIAVIRLGSRIG